jgi:ketosteroid isomerase-like protein
MKVASAIAEMLPVREMIESAFGGNLGDDVLSVGSKEASMADPDTNVNDVRDANDAFYKALSGGSIEGISAAYAHDADVTSLHEDSKEVAVGWQAVLASWEAVPFDASSELSVTMSDPVIKISGSSARVVGFEKVRGKMGNGEVFAWTLLGTNIYEKQDGKWLMVHHHASKAAEEIVVSG